MKGEEWVMQQRRQYKWQFGDEVPDSEGEHSGAECPEEEKDER